MTICLVPLCWKYFQKIFLEMVENLEMRNPCFQSFQFDGWKCFQLWRGGIVVIFCNAFPFLSSCTHFEPKRRELHFFLALPQCYLDKNRNNLSLNHSRLHPLPQPVSRCSLPFRAPSPLRCFPSPTLSKLCLLPCAVRSSFQPCAVLLLSPPFDAITVASIAAASCLCFQVSFFFFFLHLI